MAEESTRELRGFAQELAIKAGAVLMQHWGQARLVSQKGPIDLVTQADLASEGLLLAAIRKRHPDHGVVTEEKGGLGAKHHTWLIDPLDGTINYFHGYPHFSISLALMLAEELLVGVVYDPALREMFWAEKGSGAYLNDRRLRVSDTSELIQALVNTGFPYDIATTARDNLLEFARLAKLTQGPRVSGSAALDLCYVAAGRVDAFWEAGLKPWDMAAGGLIALEAGARVTDYRGGPWDPFGEEVVASNSLLHEELLRVLQGEG